MVFDEKICCCTVAAPAAAATATAAADDDNDDANADAKDENDNCDNNDDDDEYTYNDHGVDLTLMVMGVWGGCGVVVMNVGVGVGGGGGCGGRWWGHRWIPSQRLVTRSFDVRLNKWFSKPSIRRWFETPSRSLWRHCDFNWKIASSNHLLGGNIVHRHHTCWHDLTWHIVPWFPHILNTLLDVEFPNWPSLSVTFLRLDRRLAAWDDCGNQPCDFCIVVVIDWSFHRLSASQIDGLVQECSISSALAIEILQYCTKPSRWWL